MELKLYRFPRLRPPVLSKEPLVAHVLSLMIVEVPEDQSMPNDGVGAGPCDTLPSPVVSDS
jgi:hypothetical protein